MPRTDVVVRSALGPAEMSRLTRDAVAGIDPHVPVAFEEEMEAIVRDSLFPFSG